MADKELAAKLERRLASLSSTSSMDADMLSPNILPAPPPSGKFEFFPYSVAVDETIDMDELIGKELDKTSNIRDQVIQNNPQQLDPNKNGFLQKGALPLRDEIFGKDGDNPPSDVSKIASIQQQNNYIVGKPMESPGSLSPNISNESQYETPFRKCTAPIVPIVHHKNIARSISMQSDESSLRMERNELEKKLAKQRMTKANRPSNLILDFENKFLSNGSFKEEIPMDVAMNLAHQIVNTPPPTPKKPILSIMSQNSSSSPTCSLSSIRSYSVDSSDELAMKLARRNKIIEGETVDAVVARHPSIYAEFSEFSRKQIKYFIETFKKFDEDGDSFIDFNELKRMMEKLGEAQTHITLKQILKMVDEDEDGKICLREFLLIFRYSLANRLMCSNVFNELALSVDVAKEGVQAAANFFQAKIEELSKLSKFEEEIRAEREEKRQAEFEKKERRQQFLANRAVFHS